MMIQWNSSIAREADMPLSEQQIERYSRHIILREIGGAGQEKLLASKVLILGAGGLGSPAALYLAAAGVGTIGLVDGDEVDITNLHRQIVHHTADIGRRKVDSAKERMLAINPDVTVQTYDIWAQADNIREIVRQYDFVIDGADNFAAKFLINDACYFEKVPFSHAGILQFEGQLMTVIPGQTACYRCVFLLPPPAGSAPPCGQAGVLGVLPGVIGSLQATEAIKYLLGIGDLLTDSLLTYCALTMEFRKVPVGRSPDCPVCGPKATITALKDEGRVTCNKKGCKC
jgi:molybdopterin/thiamine biosynthesis adenylyltransferase